MSNLQQKLTKRRLEYQVKTTSSKKELIIGSIIATFIAITPYLITLWESIPGETKTWDTFLFTYTTIQYYDVQTLVWTLLNQLIPLLLLLIWMFTCRQWWYHVLIVPIAMYIYEIITILNDDLGASGSNLLLYLLPIMAIVIPSIYLLRAQMFNKINDADKSMEELEEEFMIKPKGFFAKLGDYF